MFTTRATLCLLLFFLYGQREVNSSAEYHLADAIEDLNFFIPGSKFILSTALKIWTVYGEVRQLIDPNSTSLIDEHLQEISKSLSEVTEKLDLVSDKLDNISDDVRDVKNLITEKVINDLPKELSLDNKLIKIYGEINKVNAMFEKFLRYNNVSKRYDNTTLINFADSVVDHSLSELPSVLNQIHHLLVDKYTGVNMLDLMSNPRLASTSMCKRRESAQHFINNLYNNVGQVETKGLLMTQFAYSIKNAFSNSSTRYVAELDDATTDSYNRTSASIAEIKKAMSVAPRDIWNCDPPEHKEGETYTKLAPIFQAYVMKENDAGISLYLDAYTNKCSDTCAERKEAYDLCRSTYCQEHGRQCSGTVHDCKSSSAELQICAADKYSGRRYDSITLTRGNEKSETLGSKTSCASDTAVNVREHIHYIYKCEYCFCICDDANLYVDRYFSLRDVTSDVNDNYVVTGIRFAKKNHIIHIQIEQGQLLKFGNINKTSVHWKAVEDFNFHDKTILINKDYHNITWSERSVDLDTMDSPPNNVLTGLRFQTVNGHIKLEIRVTPIDFNGGKLKINESKWISNSNRGRSELNVENLNLGTSSYINLPDLSANQFVKFTTSSMKTDVGQTVVPFIDLQEITSSPPVPLSGAGLIHRGDQQSAGFLSFKAITYNYAPYLQTD